MKNRSGETLIEIIMALSIIILALTSSFRLLGNAMYTKEVAKSRVIAINLAREGMEAVRYIRDYNWLYNSSKKRVCWNHFEDNDNNGILGADNTCLDNGSGMSNNQIAPTGEQDFLLKQNNTHWFLSTNGFNNHSITNTDWDTDVTFDTAKINGETLVRSTNATDATISYQLCWNITPTRMVSCANTDASHGEAQANSNAATKYFRMIKIYYDNNEDNIPEVPVLDTNTMYVITRVSWAEKKNMQDVVLQSALTDFYQRTPDDVNGAGVSL